MKINDDLLPVIVSTTEPTGKKRKKIWKQHGNNLLDIQYLELMTNQSGTVTRNVSVWNVILNVKNVSFIYVSGNFSLLGDSVLRIGKFNSYPTLGVTGSRYSLGSSGSIDCRGVNYVLLSFLDSTGTNEWINTVKNSFMINYGNTPLPWEPYVDDKEYILNNDNTYKEFIPEIEKENISQMIELYDSTNFKINSKFLFKYGPVVNVIVQVETIKEILGSSNALHNYDILDLDYSIGGSYNKNFSAYIENPSTYKPINTAYAVFYRVVSHTIRFKCMDNLPAGTQINIYGTYIIS